MLLFMLFVTLLDVHRASWRLVSRVRIEVTVIRYVCDTVEPLITDTLINEHLQ
jgi:hypothetical protein